MGGRWETRTDLRRFLAHCRQREPEAPFDVRSLLESTPSYETRAGSWLSFRQLFATVGDRDDVLDFTDPGYLAIAESLGDAFKRTRPSHPLVVKVRERKDQARAFLDSTVYSAINAHYQRITDHDELEIQAELVRGMRG